METESGNETGERTQPGFSLGEINHKGHKNHKVENSDSEDCRKERKGHKKSLEN